MSDSTELDIIKYHEQVDTIISMWARTCTINEMIRETGLTRKQINEVLQDYKEYSRQDRVIREMSRETLIKTQKHYDDIVKQLYTAVEELQAEGKYKDMADGLKKIADVEKQRVDFMQKAGVLADNEVGQQLVEMEEKHQIIIGILKKVAQKYPDVGLEINMELSKVTGRVEGVTVERLDQ